jgi:two-component system sensor histidine kinase SenX3
VFRKAKEELVIKPVLEIPREVFDILQVIDAEYLIVEPGDSVIANSIRLESLGVIADGKVVHEALRQLIRQARRHNELNQANLEIANNETRVRAFHIGNTGNIAVLVFDDAESLRLDATRRDFVANVSHELKTPIGSLSILSEAIASATDDPAALKDFANRIGKESKRLATLVSEIINLSRIQGIDSMMSAKVVDINEVIHDAIDISKTKAESRGIQVEYKASQVIEVLADKPSLVSALDNLIENAINYSPDNTTVKISLSQRDNMAEISIKDQGIGISEADIARIFERFYRVDPARSRETGGTGLGLSIVKHVINNHGGDVLVWSELGNGSTFTVRLPIVKANLVNSSPVVDQ